MARPDTDPPVSGLATPWAGHTRLVPVDRLNLTVAARRPGAISTGVLAGSAGKVTAVRHWKSDSGRAFCLEIQWRPLPPGWG